MVVALIGCASASLAVRAQDAVSLNLAVLDLNRIYRDAVAARKIHEIVNSYAEAYRQDTEQAETELRNADKLLADKRARAALSAEAFDDERRKLEQQVQQSQKKVQERRRLLAQLQAKGLHQLETVLEQVVEQLRKERGFTLILRSEHTAYVDPSLDITEEVLRRLNQQLPTVSVGANEN
jgi:outer membrane protein